MGFGGGLEFSALSCFRTSSVLFPTQSYGEDPLFRFLGYGQTGGGDSSSVSYGLVSSTGVGLSYVPEFLAKTEIAVRPLPRSFSIQSLQDFAASLPEDLLLCPVLSLHEYLRRTS